MSDDDGPVSPIDHEGPEDDTGPWDHRRNGRSRPNNGAGDNYHQVRPQVYQRSANANGYATSSHAQPGAYQPSAHGYSPPPSSQYNKQGYMYGGDPRNDHRGRPHSSGPRSSAGGRGLLTDDPARWDSDSSTDIDEHEQLRRDADRQRQRRGGSTSSRSRRARSGERKGDDAHKRSRSKSLKRRVSGIFGEHPEDGAGNSASKKWGATIAGAAAGGLAVRQAKKDHWVPAALGAIIGGFAAREAEKEFYRRREVKDKHEMEGWEGRRARSGDRG